MASQLELELPLTRTTGPEDHPDRKSWLEGCLCTAPCAFCYDPKEYPKRPLEWSVPRAPLGRQPPQTATPTNGKMGDQEAGFYA